MRRRVFFLGLLASVGWLTACGTSRFFRAEAGLRRFEFERPQMGGPFKIILYASDAGRADVAAAAAFRRAEELNAILSDYDTDSELNALSRASGNGQARPVSDDLWRVLEEAQTLAVRTGGAFDVTVGPYVSLWRRARRLGELPEARLLAEASRRVGWDKVVLERRNRTVRLTVPGMKLDLGGIAKGFVVDEAMKILRQHGIHRALIAASGDILVSEAPPGAGGWRIGLVGLNESLREPEGFLSLRHAAVSTSGDLAQRLDIAGVRYSHIVDPRTGIGLTNHSLVTVIARACAQSDSLATAVSVLGPDEGRRFASRLRRVDFRIVHPGGSDDFIEIRSPAFSRWITTPPAAAANLPE